MQREKERERRYTCTHGTSKGGIRTDVARDTTPGSTISARAKTPRNLPREPLALPLLHGVRERARARIPHTHHASRHATPRHAMSAISWKPGRFLATPDPVNKTPLHVPARLAFHPRALRPLRCYLKSRKRERPKRARANRSLRSWSTHSEETGKLKLVCTFFYFSLFFSF